MLNRLRRWAHRRITGPPTTPLAVLRPLAQLAQRRFDHDSVQLAADETCKTCLWDRDGGNKDWSGEEANGDLRYDCIGCKSPCWYRRDPKSTDPTAPVWLVAR